MEKAFVEGVKTVVQPVARNATSVVGVATVGKTVRHDEVKDVVLDGVPCRSRHQSSDLWRNLATDRGDGDVNAAVAAVIGEFDDVARVGHCKGHVRTGE